MDRAVVDERLQPRAGHGTRHAVTETEQSLWATAAGTGRAGTVQSRFDGTRFGNRLLRRTTGWAVGTDGCGQGKKMLECLLVAWSGSPIEAGSSLF